MVGRGPGYGDLGEGSFLGHARDYGPLGLMSVVRISKSRFFAS